VNQTAYVDGAPILWVDAKGLSPTATEQQCVNDSTDRAKEIEKLIAENNRSSVDNNVVVCQVLKESTFNAKAKSKSGAKGLMQLTTSATKQVFANRAVAANNGKPISDKAKAKEFEKGVDAQNSSTIYDEPTNTQYGTEFLDYTTKRNNGDVRKGLEDYNGESTKAQYADKILKCAERLNKCPGSMPTIK